MIRQLLCGYVVVMALINTACASSGAPINVKLHVVGNDNKAVADASVVMSFLLSHGRNMSKGITDANGFFEITNDGIFGVSVSVSKQGFYRTGFRAGGHGDKNLKLFLRGKKNPIAMYAKNTKILAPVLDSEFGYDLMKGDYVRPYGKGDVSDLVLKIRHKQKDFWHYDYHLSISFSNPDDGLVPFFVEHQKSRYKSDYLAPVAGYKNNWEFKRISRRGKADDTNLNKKRNYYLRVRTEVNEDGEIESAYYGKIYGEFPEIMHYLNPESNDRNIEFSGNSFLKNLADNEQVREP
jgi:hypothetical protein